jgi:hypothetical protein
LTGKENVLLIEIITNWKEQLNEEEHGKIIWEMENVLDGLRYLLGMN